MGLSAARNVALRFVADENLEAHHILFPDDDTTFPVDFFTIYQEKVKPESAVLSRVCNVDDGKNYKPFPPENLFKQTKTLLPFVASVGLIIPQKTTQQVGLFDERLGAGAEWASSEDVDYFLRCTAFTSFDFVKELFTFHPSRFGKYASMEASAIKKRFVDYTRGYMFVMVRHRADHNLWFLPWRAFGGAAASFLKGEWRLMPVYLWLAMYRFRLLRDFKKIKKTNPAFFYG
jgi:glycosyltransferase involved in cell wall biosynthesis